MLLGGFVAIQIAWDLTQLIKGDTTSQVAVPIIFWRIVWMGIVGMLLSGPGYLWDYVFNFSVNIGPYIGIKLLNIFNGTETPYTGVKGLMYIIEDSFLLNVYKMYKDALQGASIYRIPKLIGAGFIVVVYAYFVFKILMTAMKAIVQIYTVGFFSPFWIVMLAFPSTQATFWHALKVMFTAALSLIGVSAAVAMIIAAMGAIYDPIMARDNMVIVEGVDADDTGDYLQILLLGIFMIFTLNSILEVPPMILQTFLNSSGGKGVLDATKQALAGASKAMRGGIV